MAVTVSISAGHDPGYPWKSIGSAEAGAHAGKRGTTYYLDAVDKGGEPPGFWASGGLEVVGIQDGSMVDRETFERLYGEFLDPRDTSGSTRLGAAPRSNPALEARYQAKLTAAGEGLTREDKRALYYQSRAECDAEGSKRTGVMYWDTTFSVDKTISLAHATALARALDARARGDGQAAAVWEGRAAGIWDEIERSARVFADYMQRESRFVRTGHHGKRLDGAQGTAELGRFEDSRELPVAFFPQTTSRDGDPQIHIHMLWLNRVQAVSDDQWRAVDSRSMHRARGAASAVAALSLETGLAQRFGFSWAYREASKGRVIAGVSDRIIRAFSARRESINARTEKLVDAYRATHKGADPSRYQLHSLRQYATQIARPGKPEGLIDWHAQIQDWEATARRHELGALTDLARVFWRAGRPDAQTAPLTPEAERQVIAAAVAQAQDESATFGREALVYRLAMNLPDGYLAESPDQAAAVLDGLAGKAIRASGLVRLDAGEWPRVPDRFRRASGESVFTAHGTERYCTSAQLDTEEALLRRAAAPGAPRLAPDACAQVLGADAVTLEAQLHDAAQDGVTQTGLRLNQAAAAFCALTSPRRGEVIIAAAGAGKTYTAAAMARAWQAGGMGRVIGLALTSAGRNELSAAGVPECYNLAEFLGHTEEQREARGAIDPGENALIFIDEASMAGLHDVASVFRVADLRNAKVIPLGDHSQLESPSAGGALGMLARQLGYAHMEEPVRFAPGWERDASLALRAGDVSGLQAYDEHGRLHGGHYEEMAEQAARMYAADLLAGLDTCLSAYSHAEVDDLNRRAQSYMQQAGKTAGAAVALREGARARAGDLVRACRNAKGIRDGDGQHVANGDILRILRVDGESVTVERSDGHDKESGQRIWSAPYSVPSAYLAEQGDLGYASTIHTIEGATTWTGVTLTSDKRTRTSLYPGATRGRTANHIYAYPASGECAPGREPGSDPEAARARMLTSEAGGQVTEPVSTLDPVALLAPVVRRDGGDLSATETMRTELLNADHMARLWTIRQDVTRMESAERFRTALTATLPAVDAEKVLADTDDLYRALRGAEIAGLDARATLAEALSWRETDSAASMSAVLTHRVRAIAEPLTPTARRPLQTADPELAAFAAELDSAMTEREARIAEHAVAVAPLWATRALGLIPEDEAERAGWQGRAGKLGAWRELSGNEASDALGPKPPTTFPEMRAEWQRAADVTPRIDGMDLRHLTEGQLLTRRAAFERETSWAPPHVGHELGVACRAADSYRLISARHEQLAAAAEGGMAVFHRRTASECVRAAERSRDVAAILAGVQAVREQHDGLTADTKRVAVAADTELRRQGKLADADRLVSREPQAFTYETESDLPPDDMTVRKMLGLDEVGVTSEIPHRVGELSLIAATAQGQIDELRTLAEPEGEGDDELEPSEAWAKLIGRERQSVLQPAEPALPVSPRVAEAVAERDLEAGG